MSHTTPPTTPTLYVIWYRPGPGHRWVKAGRTATRSEAETLIGGSDQWFIAPIQDRRFATDGVLRAGLPDGTIQATASG